MSERHGPYTCSARARATHWRGPRGTWPIRAETAHDGEARAHRQLRKKPLDLPMIHPEVRNTIPIDCSYTNKPFPFLSFIMARSSDHPRVCRRGGDGIGRQCRPAGTHAGSTNGPTPVYNPSTYTSLGYRSGRARESGDHSARPCTIVARPCRPPSGIAGRTS